MESIPHRIILNMFLLNNAHGHPHGQSVHQEIFHINNSYAWTFAWTLCPCKNSIDEYFFDNINNIDTNIDIMSMYYHFGFPHKKAQRHLANMGSKELVSLTGRGRSAVYAYNDVDADKGHDVPYRNGRSKAGTAKGHGKGQGVLNKQKPQQKKPKK